MPSDYGGQNAKCPFYKSNNKYIISCEGLTDYSNITLNYRFFTDKKIQFDSFCCKNYQNCEIYRMLMKEKYQE